MTDTERIAALEAENAELRDRITKALDLIGPDDPVRQVLEVPVISAEFNLAGSVNAILKRAPRKRRR